MPDRAETRDPSRRAVLALAASLTLTTWSFLDACSGSSAAPPQRSSPGTHPSASDTASTPPKAHEVLVLHHAQGLTPGVGAFAAAIEHAGHTVHCPDLYDGKTFKTLDQGLAYAQQIGLDTFTQRGLNAASSLPPDLVYVGFSLGVLPAQQLAQTRPGSRGCILLEACLPPTQFGSTWPTEQPVQIHGMDHDPYFAGEGDLDNARDLVHEARHGQLFLYPGDHHLFTDNSLASYRPTAAALVQKRVLAFLAAWGRGT